MNKSNNLYQIFTFILISAGIYLTFHMHFSLSTGQGCGTGGCSSTFNSFKPLGVSNVYWGMLYYFTLAILSMMPIILKLNDIYKIFIKVRNYLIISGFAYSAFLMLYIVFKGLPFCTLCFMSFLICSSLFAITIKTKFSDTYHKSNINIVYPITLAICTLFIILNYTNISKEVYNIPISQSVVLGNPEAKVTIIEWTDFQCPFCAKSVALIDQILEKYPEDVKVVIKNFPLPSHKEAMTAARYALAAHKQQKFKEMYHLIFSNYKRLSDNENLPIKYAKKLGLDMDQFIKDFESTEVLKQIELEINQLKDSGIERLAVPKFLINGKEANKKTFEGFSNTIDQILKN